MLASAKFQGLIESGRNAPSTMLGLNVKPFDLAAASDGYEWTKRDASDNILVDSRQPNAGSILKIDSRKIVFGIAGDNVSGLVVFLDNLPGGLAVFGSGTLDLEGTRRGFGDFRHCWNTHF